MAIRLSFILFISMLCSQLAFADYYVCSNTYKTVATGDTIEQVIDACGPPEQQQNYQANVAMPQLSQSWVYVARSARHVINPYQRHYDQGNPKLIITFENGKVTQISTRNTGANMNFACYAFHRFSIGSTKDDVQFACGNPTYIDRVQTSDNQNVRFTKLTYNFGRFRPRMIFIFENDKLVKIQTGQVVP